MFITSSRHNRDSRGRESWYQYDVVNDRGLGIVVTVTTRFDPIRMKQRFTYWLELGANEIAKQVRVQIDEAGYKVDENEGARAQYKYEAIRSIPYDKLSTQVKTVVAKWSTSVDLLKKPSALKTYGIMAGKLALSYALPWVGLALTFSSFFGGKKSYKMPWATIYKNAFTFAQESFVTEESNRIIEEQIQIQKQRVEAVEKTSQRAAKFELPEGVIGIKRGALMMETKGAAVEDRRVVEVAKPKEFKRYVITRMASISKG